MPVSSLLLVLSAAVLHASWNFFIKTSEDRPLAAWWSLALGTLVFLPVFIFYPGIPSEIWPYAIASGIVEAVYLSLLIVAYRLADFSLVYPLARGTAPALLAVGAAVFLGERVSTRGMAGLLVLLVGLLVIASGPLVVKGSRNPGWKGIAAAGLVAVCIAIYSTIDAAAVRRMDPIPYNVLILSLMTIFYLPAVLIQFGTRRMAEAGRKHWRLYMVVGAFTVLTYMLVLIAYSRGHVSYAGALREVSVVIGAFLGWQLLGEKFGLLRSAGALIIFCGILLIAFAE